MDLRIIALTYKAEAMSFEAIVNEYEELRKTFGTNLSFLESYANFLFTNDKEDQIPELINNSVTLSDFEPNRDYSDSEIIDFCKIHAYYFLAKNLIFEIEPYYQVLDTLEDGNPETRLLLQDIVLRKL